MTKDKIRKVIKLYKNYLINHVEKDSKEDHCYWMLYQMEDMLEEDKMGKVMRWLGFVQGFLWTSGYFTIEELKEHNGK
jgi:hypothetical protein